MAVSYSLEMATHLTAAQVARELNAVAQAASLFEGAITDEQIVEKGVATRRGMWLGVFKEEPQPWDPVTEDLGFTPTVSVMFRLAGLVEASGQQDDMIRVASGVLARVPGDAVLEYQYEDIWLLRRAGDLSLNEQDDLWPPHRLALVDQPYHRATYHFSNE